MSDIEKLKDDLKKLYGLPPYNTPSNFTYGDPYFSKYIYDTYDKMDIEKALKELGVK